MSKLKPVLGRGLDALIPRATQPPAITHHPGRHDDGVGDDLIAHIELARIEHNPYQPRADFNPVAQNELKRSIQEKGVIQPITVRRMDNGYQLISGERRVRAAREAGLTHIPAYIIRVHNNEEMLELALIENLQRETLNPIEIAISYRRLMDECHFTQEQVSQKIGKDRSTITNFLRLLKLPDVIQEALRKSEVSTGHARALITLEDPVTQMEIFQKIVDKGISVREVERLVRERGSRTAKKHVVRMTQTSSSLESVEEKLRQLLGTKVQVRMVQDGKGEIVVEFYSADDLERLVDLLLSIQDRPNR